MKITEPKNKKEIIALVAAIIVSLCVLGGAVFYFIQNNSPQTSSVTTPVQIKTDLFAQSDITPNQQQPYTLTNQPSPFASQPTTSTVIDNPTPPSMPEMPPIPPIEPIMLPSSSLESTPPLFDANNKIEVTGIVIGVAKAAILNNGQSQITVKEGSQCQWGKVTSISKNGVVLDGEYITMNR